MEAFGIFEGGGAKGLAHAGALKAAEEKGVEFAGVAGTSAGAIVAALIASGHTSDDIYSPEFGGLFSIDLTKLLEEKEWRPIKKIKDRFTKEAKEVAKSSSRMPAIFVLLISFALVSVPFFLGNVSLAPSLWALMFFGTGALGIVFGILCIVFRTLNTLFVNFLGRIWFCVLVFWTIGWNLPLVLKMIRHGGILSSDRFQDWLNQKLAEKIFGHSQEEDDDRTVTFNDLEVPLKIIAADSESKQLRVFSRQEDGEMSVAEAVCASMSIPFLFKPFSLDGTTYVDGGIMSNFPAWVFDLERERHPIFTPTIGFKLVSEGPEVQKKSWSFSAHLIGVCQSAFFGDTTLETRNVSTFRELQLPVDINVVDFDVIQKKKTEVYNGAYIAALKELGKPGLHWRVSDTRIIQELAIVEDVLRQRIPCPTGHLRLNIMLPIDNTRLQVAYRIHMDDDCDDDLVFEKGQGAAGQCWNNKEAIICNLQEAAENSANWRLNKYQKRLVRDSLVSLVSVPIVDVEVINDDESNFDEAFIGVLNVDSDEDLLQGFRNVESNGSLYTLAARISKELTTIQKG